MTEMWTIKSLHISGGIKLICRIPELGFKTELQITKNGGGVGAWGGLGG